MSIIEPFINGVYVENTLGINAIKDKQIVTNLAASVYNAVILAFLHTHAKSPNDLYYNDTQIYRNEGGHMVPVNLQLLQTIRDLITQIKSGPSKPRVLLSLGPQQSDYENIKKSVPEFAQNLHMMSHELGLDGVDFDYEGMQDNEHQTLVAELATQYWAHMKPHATPTITAAPYWGPAFWAGVLEQSKVPGGNAFSWFNLQLYAGANPEPQDGAGLFGVWEQAIAKVDCGIPNASRFIAPGVSADPSNPNPYTPAMLTALVANTHQTYPDIGGAFVWKYGYVASDIKAWSQATLNGLGPATTATRKAG